MPSANLVNVQSVNEFDSIIRGLDASKACFVDFTATWCPPCKMIGPIFEGHAAKFSQAHFLKVDVDKVQPVAARYGVRAMPTFIVIKGGNKIDEMMGANPPGLKALIEKHAGPAVAAEPATEDLLKQYCTSSKVSCLNESSDHPIKDMILPGSRKSAYLESDSDPELLIHIEFLQAVKIKSIAFFAGVSPEQGPKTVHLFINQPQFDFNDVDSHTPTQELTLTDKDIKGEKVDLRFVRFQSVNSLHILIKDNQGGEETTRIDSLQVYGSALQATSNEKLTTHQH